MKSLRTFLKINLMFFEIFSLQFLVIINTSLKVNCFRKLQILEDLSIV